MKEKVKIKWLLMSAIVLLVSLTGITYAWFRQDAAMTTLLSIEKPDTITITDADGSEMTELNLFDNSKRNMFLRLQVPVIFTKNN